MIQSLSFIEYTRSILGILLFIVLFILLIPISFVLVLLTWGKFGDIAVKYFAPGIAIPVLRVIGIKFEKVLYEDTFSKPAIYLINHNSTLDIPTMMAVGVPKIRFVAKWELQYLPFIFIMGRLTGQVFIKRQNSEKAIATLKKTYIQLKKHNRSIMVAPEGSRKHEGIIGPFKKGAFRMAIDLGYPIVPIYFEGNNDLSLGGSMFAKSGTVKAHIHPAIDTSSWKLDTLEDHIAEVRGLYLKWAGVEA